MLKVSHALNELSRVLTAPEYPGYLRHGVARAFKEQAQPVPDVLFHRLHAAETLEERREIVATPGASGDARAFPALLAIVNNLWEDLSLRRTTISALHEFGQDRAAKPLILEASM